MGELDDKIKEAIYESGAVPRSANCVVWPMRYPVIRDQTDPRFIVVTRVWVGENEIADSEKTNLSAKKIINSVFASESQAIGAVVWFYLNSDTNDTRYASVSRDDFDANKAVEVSSRFKELISKIPANLKGVDRFTLKPYDFSYLVLDLKIEIATQDENISLDSLKNTLSEVAKALQENDPVVGKLFVTVFPQLLVTNLDCQKEIRLESVEFEPRDPMLSRFRHLA